MKCALLIAALIAALLPGMSDRASQAGTRQPHLRMVAATESNREGPCRIKWKAPYYQDGDTRPVRQLIRCAVRRWDVPGGVTKALDVARCESGLRPDADNGACAGVYQQMGVYWRARAEHYLKPEWGVNPSKVGPWNAWANVIVSIRMAHANGWGAWSCG